MTQLEGWIEMKHRLGLEILQSRPDRIKKPVSSQAVFKKLLKRLETLRRRKPCC